MSWQKPAAHFRLKYSGIYCGLRRHISRAARIRCSNQMPGVAADSLAYAATKQTSLSPTENMGLLLSDYFFYLEQDIRMPKFWDSHKDFIPTFFESKSKPLLVKVPLFPLHIQS